MFSDLTNQVSLWIEKLKRDDKEEDSTILDASDFVLSSHKNDIIVNCNLKNTGDSSENSSTSQSPNEKTDHQLENEQRGSSLVGPKSLGSIVYSVINGAGKSVREASAKIKEKIENNNILEQFNKEQNSFIYNRNSNTATSLAPWTGCPNEEALKDECLSLSFDRRNFVRNPPDGVNFEFDYCVSYPVAMAAMEQDSNLEQMRYNLVPGEISEQIFWRNYFYRISLICQANEIASILRDNTNHTRIENNMNTSEPFLKDEHQLIFDLTEIKSKDLEIQQELNIDWEHELEAELLDYELVNGQKLQNDNSEEDIEEIF